MPVRRDRLRRSRQRRRRDATVGARAPRDRSEIRELRPRASTGPPSLARRASLAQRGGRGRRRAVPRGARRRGRRREAARSRELLERGDVDEIAARVMRLMSRVRLRRRPARSRSSTILRSSRRSPSRCSPTSSMPTPYIERMLSRAGLAAARALWAARIRRPCHATRDACASSSWLRIIGRPADELLRVALGQLARRTPSQGQTECAEDLLLALPRPLDARLARRRRAVPRSRRRRAPRARGVGSRSRPADASLARELTERRDGALDARRPRMPRADADAVARSAGAPRRSCRARSRCPRRARAAGARRR